MAEENILAVVADAVEQGLLTEDDMRSYQEGLWELLDEQIKKYTMGDSTSVRIETGEELFRSIAFSIALHLKTTGEYNKLRRDGIRATFSDSKKTLLEAIEEGKRLYQTAYSGKLTLGNIAYDETLQNIDKFFKWYDYRLFAHQIPCDIDYLLCHPIAENKFGIQYINCYLETIIIENSFCSLFEERELIKLLNSYCADYKELLINIYEPVATNVIGFGLLNKYLTSHKTAKGCNASLEYQKHVDSSENVELSDSQKCITSLNISRNDRQDIFQKFSSLDNQQAIELLTNTARNIARLLGLNSDEHKYLEELAKSLYPRIKVATSHKNLEGLFLSYK